MAIRTYNFTRTYSLLYTFLDTKKKNAKKKKKKETTSTSLPYPQVSPNCPKYATEEANWTRAIWQHLSSQSSWGSVISATSQSLEAQLDLKPHLVLLGSALDISNHTAHAQLPEYRIHTQNTHIGSQKGGRKKNQHKKLWLNLLMRKCWCWWSHRIIWNLSNVIKSL